MRGKKAWQEEKLVVGEEKKPILITKKLNCNNHKTFSNSQSLKGDGLGSRNYLEADKPSIQVNSSDQTLTLDERTRNRPKWDKNDPKTISSIHFLPNSIESFFWALCKQFWFGRNKTTLMSFFYNLSVMSGLGPIFWLFSELRLIIAGTHGPETIKLSLSRIEWLEKCKDKIELSLLRPKPYDHHN